MPDYKRFIAYFYEYIDGKRQRNAGFLKAERRGGMWRLQLQLRASRWPDGGLQIFGYVDEGKRCPAILLGKAYAQKEDLTKRLQFGTDTMDPDGLQFENLSGIWIPCDEQRCYISHWLEKEIEPERLLQPEKAPAKEEKQTEEQMSAGKESAERLPEADTTKSVYPEENISNLSNLSEEEQAGENLSEIERVKENLSKEKQSEAELTEGAETGEAQEPQRAAQIQAEEIPEEMPEEMPGEMPGAFPGENSLGEQDSSEEKRMGEERNKKQEDWIMLQKSRRSVQPFDTEELSCIRICPRDILWLKQRGWPVGRNSFVMQGFWQFRHLVLARDEAGAFFLGVPGQENENNRSYAAAFGFPEFRRGKSFPEAPGNFGYWCRRLE